MGDMSDLPVISRRSYPRTNLVVLALTLLAAALIVGV